MASPDLIVTAPACDGVALPVNPFVSNRYHFGMLLGVADLDTDQGYHRGKTWLHTAWLHGHGTVWGLRAELRASSNELAVAAGLAIDRRGRELSVAEILCVDLGLWYAQKRPDDLEVTDDGAGGVLFDLDLVLCARQCLDRPVPSIADGCEGSGSDTAYSRAVEQGLPVLQPRPAAAAVADPYDRVRQLMGLADPVDPLVIQALDDIAAADSGDRLALARERLARVLAADAMARGPADLFPEPEPGCVLLAAVRVHLAPQGEGWRVVQDGADPTTVDNLARPALAPTGLLQDLLVPPAGLADGGARQAAPGRGGSGSGGAGPVAEAASLEGATLTLRFSAPLNPATVQPDAFTATALRPGGWQSLKINRARLADPTTVSLTLASAVRSRPVRVLAHGAGPRPLLGEDDSLLEGGRDAALMIREE
ncbi:hypothetical protein [Actinoplanes sp. M2I2]|uniref:hypothetical protein n=1 Tax=Actinoplanes sp. M2I2 TaxID=1734444 RepID=UPI00201FC33E|nr:hypothetical protein [Actinoplanes sp. M2I2]